MITGGEVQVPESKKMKWKQVSFWKTADVFPIKNLWKKKLKFVKEKPEKADVVFDDEEDKDTYLQEKEWQWQLKQELKFGKNKKASGSTSILQKGISKKKV